MKRVMMLADFERSAAPMVSASEAEAAFARLQAGCVTGGRDASDGFGQLG